MTTQTHQPVAYQIEDANGEFMCLSRTKSTIRGIASKPLYAESALEKERTSRIEAHQRLADMQELAAKSGLAHRKAVQAAVSDAMKRMQAGEKLSYTDKEVELIMLGWQSELQKAVVAERDACALICYKNWQSVSGDEIRARGTP